MRTSTLLVAGALPLVAAGLAYSLAGDPEPSAAAAAAARSVRAGASHAWLAAFQDELPNRALGRPAHRSAPERVRAALAAAGARDARLDLVDSGLSAIPPMHNVLARVPGRDGARSVVLAAHYDTVPGAPGAIDDGGAIAALVEATRVLAAGPPPPCDVEIAVFDGEESGLIGSKAHVEGLGESGRSRVAAALALELVGWRQDRLVVHTIPSGFAWDSPGIVPAFVPVEVLAAGRDAGVTVGYGDPWLSPLYQATVRLLGVGTGSDAGAFAERGVPACMLAGSSLANFYSAYHTPRDTMALVSRERLDDAARLTVAAAVRLADRAVGDSPRALGDTYVVVGGRVISESWLMIVALAALVAGLAGSRHLSGEGDRAAARLLSAAGMLTALSAATGLVAGVLAGVPLVAFATLAIALPAAWRLALLVPAGLPVLLQALLLGAAGAAFGFRWRGGATGAAILVLLGIVAIGLVVLVRIHRPPRVPFAERRDGAPRGG